MRVSNAKIPRIFNFNILCGNQVRRNQTRKANLINVPKKKTKKMCSCVCTIMFYFFGVRIVLLLGQEQGITTDNKNANFRAVKS